jgi:hypothetical protein
MKTRGKRPKRKRGPGMSFGELVRKLWQPEAEVPEPKATPGRLRKPVTKGKRPRKR